MRWLCSRECTVQYSLFVHFAALIPTVSAMKNCCLMGCDTMLSHTNVPTFQRNLLCPSSAQMSSYQTIWHHIHKDGSLRIHSHHIIYPALLLLMRTPRLPAVDWTDAPADLNGLIHFAERWNLVSARVPSYFKRSLQVYINLSWVIHFVVWR